MYHHNVLYFLIIFVFFIISVIVRKVKINKIIGYRTFKSYSSIENWRVLNDKFSDYLIISQIIGFLLNLFLIFIKYCFISSEYAFVLIDFSLVFYVIFSIIYILIKLNEIEKKL
ncbi:MAG: hypothetical protein DCC88_01285 [Spirobacillus cienkowskii]|jgi:hypothetical protein|uniref:SdpI family protein n=1 Tax=Spirobacillus cienkowskii TaxID=495820 RepID=A0A369KR89_9BACT|nr:MAG: hypothetical protein DCC88_01285 [Spirobacillus cienkowskii]